MMKRIVVFSLFIVLLAAACDSGAPVEITDLDMSMVVNPDPSEVGPATLMITIKDADGNSVDGAKLSVHGDMDHEGMVPVDREVNTSTEGIYEVPFEWTMGGGWIVTITAELPDNRGQFSETFELFVEAIPSDSIINQNRPLTGDIQVNYYADNDPALAGDGEVFVTVVDADGTVIDDATVLLSGTMTHEGMMPIAAEANAFENNAYQIPLRWTMAGEWQVTIRATLPDGSVIEKDFDQQVAMPEADDMRVDDMEMATEEAGE